MVALAAVDGAGALEAEPVTYDPTSGEPQRSHVDAVMATTDGGTIVTPDECAVLPYCTVVPIEITPLDRGENEDWVVQLDISWDAQNIQTPENLAGSQNSSDLDIYLYHYGPLFDADGNPEMNEDGSQAEGYIETGRSASGNNPEILKLYRPSEKNYWMVAVNFVGATAGFDIDFSFTDTSFGGLGDFVTDRPNVAPAASNNDRLSFGDTPARPSSVPVRPSISPTAAPFVDDDFGFSNRVPANLLDADEGPVRGSLFEEKDLAPPKDVSGSTLLLWLGLLPIVLVAGAVAFLVKRRPSALSIRFPVRGATPEPAEG